MEYEYVYLFNTFSSANRKPFGVLIMHQEAVCGSNHCLSS